MPTTKFYDTEIVKPQKYIYSGEKKININNIKYLPLITTEYEFSSRSYKRIARKVEPYFRLAKWQRYFNVKCDISDDVKKFFAKNKEKYTKEYLCSKISDQCLNVILNKIDPNEFDKKFLKGYVSDFLKRNKDEEYYKEFCTFLDNISDYSVTLYSGEMYSLKDYCDEVALLLFQFYCIKLKETGKLNDYISEQTSRYIKIMANVVSFKNEKELPLKMIYGFFKEGFRICDKRMALPSFRNFSVSFNTKKQSVDKSDVLQYFSNLEFQLDDKTYIYYNSDTVFERLSEALRSIEKNLKKNIVDEALYYMNDLYEKMSDEEAFMIKNGYIKSHLTITKAQLDYYNRYKEYDKKINDKESAVIGVDLMKQIKINDIVLWTESSSVSSKIDSYNKFNSFLSQRYAAELMQAKSQYVKGKNTFNLDKKCNSVIGYCVEYYSKYLVYGEEYLSHYIEQAQREVRSAEKNDCIIIRACMLKYKELMTKSFGLGVAKIIKGIPVNQLIQKKYEYFVNLVVELGTKTANYVKSELYADGIIKDDIDPNLSIRHITGLADYITSDTILDVKVRNYIDEKCVRQVLAYHYLSTKRSDLDIKKVIVYDAVSNKAITIDILHH